MTGYESGEIEKIDGARHKEEVEVESRGSCEGEKESQGRDEARLRGENRETGRQFRGEEKGAKLWRARYKKKTLQSMFIILECCWYGQNQCHNINKDIFRHP